MDVFNNCKKYQQYKPEYANWKKEQDLREAQRQEYLKKNPSELNTDDVQRGQSLLYAIDVMDEYSQKNAEDMEVATEMAASQAISLVEMAGIGLGTATLAIPGVTSKLKNLTKKNTTLGFAAMFIPTLIGMAAGVVASIPIMAWSAKAQVGASRKGRFEAMRKDLKNPNNFAVLSDEQRKKIEEDAKKIPLDKDMKKLLKNDNVPNMGFIETVQTLKKLAKGDPEYKKQRAEFENQLEAHEKNFDKTISPEDADKAKKDQQILSKLVQKIDIASQDYAENVELATNAVTITAFAGGSLVGWLSDKLIKGLKVKGNPTLLKMIPWGVGVISALAVSISAAKIQKQASRVARFNVRKELFKDPNNFAYVEDEKADKMKDTKQPDEKKKLNFFKFLVQAFKDNKKYTKYMKTKGIEEKKFHKALEKAELTPEQIKKAKTLQTNTFKTFNKVDEMSQTYSESVEAAGQMVQQGAGMIFSFIGMGVGFLLAKKDFKAIKTAGAKEAEKLISKIMTKVVGGSLMGVLPVLLLDIFITKEQKKASRIADMLAIKEMQDYRHYVDYNNLQTPMQKETISTNKTPGLLEKFSMLK